MQVEEKVINNLVGDTAKEGTKGKVDIVGVWGSTVHHLDDLPYNPRETFPHVYGFFRKK